MKTISWKEVDAHLGKRAAKAAMRDTEAFGSDFKARAALVRQDLPGETREHTPFAFRWGYAVALATLLVVLGVIGLPLHSAAITQIKSLEVVAPHSGIIIMNDQLGRGTILWITGMESENSGG